MILAVAEQFQIHPQTLRLYEREGLLKPSRSDAHASLYRRGPGAPGSYPKPRADLGVNLAGVEIILNMREKMGEMQRQIEAFVAGLNKGILIARAWSQPFPPAR